MIPSPLLGHRRRNYRTRWLAPAPTDPWTARDTGLAAFGAEVDPKPSLDAVAVPPDPVIGAVAVC
jgi:hypothetical protein